MAVNKNTRESSRQPSTAPRQESGFEQAKDRGQQPVDTSSVSTRSRGDRGSEDFDYESAARTADGTDNPDGHKYQVAVERARQIAGDDVSESQMRDLVDAEFAKMNPTVTGEQMRGEDNFGARAVGSINDAIDFVTGLAGDGIDFLWDGVAGNVAGLVGDGAGLLTGNDDWGQQANEFVSGLVGDDGNGGPTILDTDMLGDVALDLAISAIPGAGVPLMVGKSLLQNSNNIREAVDGRDSISGEKLDPGQIATKLLATGADTALSALPGIGRARNLTKASQLASGSADDVARFVESPATATLLETFSPSNVARETTRGLGEASRRVPRAVSDMLHGRGAIGALTERSPQANIADEIGAMLSTDAAKSAAPGATKKLLLSTAPTWITGFANMPLQAAAYGDTDYATALEDIVDDARSDGLTGISPYLTALLPLGAARVTNARSMPGPSGRASSLSPALRYAQVGAVGDAGKRGMASSRDSDAMSDEDIDEYLSRIGGGSLASDE